MDSEQSSQEMAINKSKDNFRQTATKKTNDDGKDNHLSDQRQCTERRQERL